MAYAYQATVAIPAPSGTRADFTVPISTGTNALYKPVGSGGAIQNSGTAFTSGPTVPFDLIVSSDAAATLLYNWTIKAWDQTNGVVWIYIKIPSWTTSLTIYITFGNVLTNSWQGGILGSAFDANRKLAWLLGDGSALSAVDFSSSANNGTITGASVTTGQIDGAASFNGSTNRIQSAAQVISVTAFTLSAWINPTSFNNVGAAGGIFYQGSGASQEGMALTVYQDGTPFTGMRWSAGNGGYLKSSNGVITLNVWQKVTIIYNAGSITFLVNGVSAGTGSANNGTFNTTAYLGFWYLVSDATRFFAGKMSDLDYASTVRATGWVLDQYTVENSPPTAGAPVAIATPGGGMLTLMGVG